MNDLSKSRVAKAGEQQLYYKTTMHTLWVRLNAVVFFGLSVLLGLSLLAAFSTIVHSQKPSTLFVAVKGRMKIGGSLFLTLIFEFSVTVSFFSSQLQRKSVDVKDVEVLALNTLRSLKSHGGVDRALLSFDIKVDLGPAFHWNVKQLFVYVVAIYETEDGRDNQVVLWDKIVEAGDNKVINEENVFVKYALVDQGDKLRGKNVTLQLQWDHMPITGTLHMDKQSLETTSHFILPIEYQ